MLTENDYLWQKWSQMYILVKLHGMYGLFNPSPIHGSIKIKICVQWLFHFHFSKLSKKSVTFIIVGYVVLIILLLLPPPFPLSPAKQNKTQSFVLNAPAYSIYMYCQYYIIPTSFQLHVTFQKSYKNLFFFFFLSVKDSFHSDWI